jgi:hypothetical protein
MTRSREIRFALRNQLRALCDRRGRLLGAAFAALALWVDSSLSRFHIAKIRI